MLILIYYVQCLKFDVRSVRAHKFCKTPHMTCKFCARCARTKILYAFPHIPAHCAHFRTLAHVFLIYRTFPHTCKHCIFFVKYLIKINLFFSFLLLCTILNISKKFCFVNCSITCLSLWSVGIFSISDMINM